MTVVSDTSPINYFVLIELQSVLPALFGQILIPAAVQRELQAHGTPEVVRQWMTAPPAWLEIRSAPQIPTGAGARAQPPGHSQQ